MSRGDGSDCPTGKIQWTQEAARERRDWWRAQGDLSAKAYRCLFCSCFHVGHTNRRRERLRARSGSR